MTLERAFAELRPAMFALAYRITGSGTDADDIVQEAFLRLHQAEPEEAVRSLKAYLATITARLSFNHLRDTHARREDYVGEWLPEPVLTRDEPAVRAEDVSFALLVVLERLSPLERVVFVLRNAFDLTFEEIGRAVGRDAAACRKNLSRARARVAQERPRFAVDREHHRQLMHGFLEATRAADMERLVSLLANDVVFHGDGGGRALAIKKPIVGSAVVARFLIAVTRTMPPNAVIEEIELNGAPGLVGSIGTRPLVAIMLDTDGERIHSVFAVANPDKLGAIA